MDEPRKRTDRLITAAVAAAGGLGLLWLLRPDGPVTPGIVDTRETRAETLKTLNENLGIPGAVKLAEYLKDDGFLDFKWIPSGAPVGNNTPLYLGRGTGKTVWPHALSELQRFNRPEGGLIVRRAVERAIKGTPLDDDPASRALVLDWLQALARGNNPGFAELVQDLTNGKWTSGSYTPPIPPEAPPKISLHLSIGTRQDTILLYPKWLADANTSTILDRIDPLAYPSDPTAAARDLIWLQVELAAVGGGVPGFGQFQTLLNDAGWNTHPFNKKVPPPNSVIAPLGGLASVNISKQFEELTVNNIGSLVGRALDSFDPTLAPRVAALAELRAVKSHKWAKYFTNFDVLADALAAAGFVEVPRGARPIPNGAVKDFYVTGITEHRPVWSAVPTKYPTLQDFVNSASVAEIQKIAQSVTTYSAAAFTRWVCIQTFLNPNIWVGGKINWLSKAPAATTAELVKRGVLMDPPQQVPAFSPGTYWSVVYSGSPNGNNPGPLFDASDLFKTKLPYKPPPNTPPIYGLDLLQRATWQAYWIAAAPNEFTPAGLNNAPGVMTLTATELAKGEPVVGVAGASFADLAAQVTTPPDIKV
jgi:hypothetical protein